MQGRVVTIVTAVLGVAGLGLLIFEGIETQRNIVLHALGIALLFVGLGLVIVAGVLLAFVVLDQAPPRAAGDATVRFAGDDPIATP